MFNYLKEPKWMSKWTTTNELMFVPIYTTSKEYYKRGFCIDFNEGWLYRCVRSRYGVFGLATHHIWNLNHPEYFYKFMSKEKVIDMDRVKKLMEPYLVLANL